MSGTEVQLCYGVNFGTEWMPWEYGFHSWWVRQNLECLKLRLEPGMTVNVAYQTMSTKALVDIVGEPPVVEILCGVVGSTYNRILAVPSSVHREDGVIGFDPTKLIVDVEEVRVLKDFCKRYAQMREVPEPEWYASFYQY